MLLLLRANVPSGELLAASTDREFGLLALKYKIDLPLHLSHLPLLPAPKPPAPPEPKVAPELEGTAIKDRPPREIRMRLKDAKKDTVPPSPTGSQPSPLANAPGRAFSKPSSKARRPSLPPPEQDELMQGKGSAVKERAPSTRRPRRTPKERPRPQQTAPLEPAEDPIKGTAVKERAPSQRRPVKGGKNARA